MKKRIFRLIAIGVLTASAFSLLSGCGGSTAMNSSYEASSASSYASYGKSYDRIEPAMNQELAMETAAGGELTSGTAMQPIATERKLIRNANLSVEATSFDVLLEGINKTVTELGGYMEQSDVSGNSISASAYSRRYAFLTVRIPSNKLDQFITQISEQGNITSKSESTQDVTLQYSDIESRKKSLTIEQERIWALLEKADTLEAVIALESRLSEIRYQLESFESQLRLYDNQVDYSTVTLNINEVQVFTPTTPDSVMTRIQKGFSRNLAGVSNGLVNFFIWFISSIPVFLLLAVIIALICFVIRKVTKKRNPRKHAIPSKNEQKETANSSEQASEEKNSEEY